MTVGCNATDTPEQGLEFVFEGCTYNSSFDHVIPHYDIKSLNPRVQLRTEEPNIRGEYTHLYDDQLKNIIEGYNVFAGDDDPNAGPATIPTRNKGKQSCSQRPSLETPIKIVKGLYSTSSHSGNYSNWIAEQTIEQGGSKIQHPHCATAVVNSYANLDVFPFVCMHAFGLEEFTLWLFSTPLARSYGFEHTFGPKNMLLMRGDFLYAGGPGCNARAHLKFFPRETAGWTRKCSFWNLPGNTIQPIFLWQNPTYPFGFPMASEPNPNGDIEITYPPSTTTLLRIRSQKQCREAAVLYVPDTKRTRHDRKELYRKIQTQAW